MKRHPNPYLKTELQYFMHTFKRQPLLLTRARGSRVWDHHGRMYFDFYSGLAVCGIGHNNERVVAAIRRQSDRLLHASNYFYTEPQMAAAKKLTARWKNSRVFFSNSGGEANETAVKLARLWAAKSEKKGRMILTFQNAFHGRSLAMTAASQGAKRKHDDFAPLPAGFVAVPFNDLAAAKRTLSSSFIAVMLEPVQGEGGIHVATRAFFRGLAALCRERNLLLIVDEIQSGMARTGTFFAFEQYGVAPDIVTLAKGLAGGLPLGATLANPRVARHVQPGLHGSTFGGNPVACAASLEVLEILTPAALRTIRKTSDHLHRSLATFADFSVVKEIRTLGLMIGIELREPGDPYVALARDRGLLINCTQGNVLRFLPPYFISRAEMDQCLSILRSVFATLSPVDARRGVLI